MAHITNAVFRSASDSTRSARVTTTRCSSGRWFAILLSCSQRARGQTVRMRTLRRCCRRRRSSKPCSCTRSSSTRRTSSTTCKTSSKVGRPHARAVRQHVHARGSAIGGCAVRFALVRHVRRAGLEVAPTRLLGPMGHGGVRRRRTHSARARAVAAPCRDQTALELARQGLIRGAHSLPYAAACGWLQQCVWLVAMVMRNGNPRWALTSATGGGAERVEQRHHRVEPRLRRGVPLLPGALQICIPCSVLRLPCCRPHTEPPKLACARTARGWSTA